MNPPIVYEVTNPSAHMINRITKIVQSMFQLLSGYKPITSNLLSTQGFSPYFLVRLFFLFRGDVNRAATMTHKFLSFVANSFGGFAQLLPLLIKEVQSLPTAVTKRFPRSFSREQRSHQPTDRR
jgi:hypothetical protein